MKKVLFIVLLAFMFNGCSTIYCKKESELYPCSYFCMTKDGYPLGEISFNCSETGKYSKEMKLNNDWVDIKITKIPFFGETIKPYNFCDVFKNSDMCK